MRKPNAIRITYEDLHSFLSLKGSISIVDVLADTQDRMKQSFRVLVTGRVPFEVQEGMEIPEVGGRLSEIQQCRHNWQHKDSCHVYCPLCDKTALVD